MSAFMKSLTLLVKYRILMWMNVSKRRRKARPGWMLFLVLAIIGVSFGVPGYYLSYKLFSAYSQVSLGSITLSDLFLELSLLGILALVLLIDTPSVILNVFMADDVQYLLTLPLPESAIFYFKLLVTLIEGAFPALFFIPLFLAYGKAVGMAWYLVIAYFVLYAFYVLLCAGLAGFIALGIGKFASKSGAKRFMLFSSTVSLVLVYLVMNLTSMPNANSHGFQSKFIAYISKVNSPLLPSTWFLKSVKGNLVYVLVMVGVAVGVFSISHVVSKRALLSGVSNVKSSSARTKRKRRNRSYRVSGVFYSLLKKDMKLLRREPTVLFMVLYPAVFPFLFILPNTSNPKEFLTGELMGVFMASTYLIISMASLVLIDLKAEWVLKILPVKKSLMAWSKSLTVIGMYVGVLAATFTVISAIWGGWMFAMLVLALAIPPFLMSTFFGIYAVLKWPNPVNNVKKPLNITGSFISTAIGVLAAGCVAAQSIYFYTNGVVGSFKGWVSVLFFLAIPTGVEIVFGYFVVKKVKKIDWGDSLGNGNSR